MSSLLGVLVFAGVYRSLMKHALALSNRKVTELGLELQDVGAPKPVLSPELLEQVTAVFTAALKAPRLQDGSTSKYLLCEPKDLIIGQPKDAARGLAWYLGIDEERAHEGLAHSLANLKREIADFGTDEDKECLNYILHEPAGSSDKIFANGVRDEGRNGETIDDFVNHPNAKRSGLSFAHVVALRLYTTAAFKSLNGPLRDLNRVGPYPFPITAILIKEAIGKLRTIGAEKSVQEEIILWRGMRDVAVTDEFVMNGGTEVAPMSTTSDINVALEYSRSDSSLLFKIVTTSFMQRGADLSWLSAFPGEAELLYPPLTYLEPTGNRQLIGIPGREETMTIVEVKVHIGG